MELNSRISKFENKVWLILLVVLAFVLISGFFVYRSLTGIVNEITEEARPDETVLLMKEILYDLTDAENSVKSYSLTKEAPYLEAYNTNFVHVEEKLAKLIKLTDADTSLKTQVDSLDYLISEKFVILEDLLLLSGQSRVSSALDKVSEKIESSAVNTKSDKKTNDVSETPVVNETSVAESKVEEIVTEEKFFKKLRNKRKNEESEKVVEPEKVESTTEKIDVSENPEKTEKSEKLSMDKIHQEILLVKSEEEKIDRSVREKELFLIQEDKKITDRILGIFISMEAQETLSMEEKLAMADESSTKTKVMIGVFCLLACGLLIFAGYAVNTYVKRNDAFKIALRKAKHETDQKNKEITDSITYAQKIQEAILPDHKILAENLNESFILYKPKDIVAGDFYWTVKKSGVIYCAVADCTGHGVPGAMVSVVCSTALNRCVQEFGLTQPAAILDKCRELVIETFASGTNNINDGMDIALITLEYKNEGGKKSAMVEYAGANNSLYIVKNGLIQDVPADKQPIGKYDFQKSFTNHKLILEKGDMLYLFSDGYADQFGGPYGKKFKYKPFQEMLIKNATVDVKYQKQNLDTTFENWRGSLEQIDDVCIIGVRV
jgi:serine phosphatase RsbU (regulator of sigma subunit)/CHASE3 domain sensor protein